MKNKAEIVIIGAGIMGASLAYFLAKKGKEVLVLERDEIGSGTSSSTAAWLWFSDKRPEFYGQLAKEARERYLTLEEELDADCEITFSGTIELAHSEEELESIRGDLYPHCQKMGYEPQMLNREELLAIEPILNKDLAGGCLVPTDGHINPFLLVDAYIQAAKRLGAEVCTHTEVEDFVVENGRITKIVTNKGEVEPGLVICAAGIYSRGLGQKLGLDAHVLPERGFCLVSEKLPPVLHHTVTTARQTASGNIVFGFIADKVDCDCVDRRMYPHGLQLGAEDVMRDMPELKDVNIIRSYTGIRCKPEDKFPIVGPTGTIENFWFHLAHSAFAVNTALSDKVAELVVGERTPETLEKYLYSRFQQ